MTKEIDEITIKEELKKEHPLWKSFILPLAILFVFFNIWEIYSNGATEFNLLMLVLWILLSILETFKIIKKIMTH